MRGCLPAAAPPLVAACRWRAGFRHSATTFGIYLPHPTPQEQQMSTPPHWDVSNIYPSLESKEFKKAVADYKAQVASLEKFFDKKLSKAGRKTPSKDLARLTGEAVDRLNEIMTLAGT